jgi:hypothetical protein
MAAGVLMPSTGRRNTPAAVNCAPRVPETSSMSFRASTRVWSWNFTLVTECRRSMASMPIFPAAVQSQRFTNHKW